MRRQFFRMRLTFMPWAGILWVSGIWGCGVVVYLDLVMLLNFLVDFFLLLGTDRLAGFPTNIKRSVLAAVLGSVYSGVCFLPRFRFLGNSLWRMVSLGLMASIAFGWNRTALRRGVVFTFLSMALGGLAVGLGNGSFSAILLSAAGVWLLCRLGFGGQLGQEYVPISICDGDRNIQVMALKDTGNTLRDPITGEQVIIIDVDTAQRLTGLSRDAFCAPMETMVKNPGYRLIPYHAVGQPGGMLLAKRYENVIVAGERRGAMIAFAPEIVDRSGNYQALAGGVV